MCNAHCSCGHVQFGLRGQPLLRAFCHCTICQAFNKASFADISLFKRQDVVWPASGTVNFSSYKSPPILQRGQCAKCGGAAIEYLQVPAIPKIVVVPTRNIADSKLIIEPSMHIFYDKRTASVEDALPKHSGYLKSQLAFTGKLIASLVRS